MKTTIKKITKKLAPPQVKQYYEKRQADTYRLIDIQAKLDRALEYIEHGDNRLHNLRKLIGQVEHYQPTYGVAGIIGSSARDDSRRRAALIESYIKPLGGKRIIEFGSSLGYFPFYFADRGAFAEGWESNPDNCEVARRIQEINGVEATFKTKELNLETVVTLDKEVYDIALVLSVFHHIIRFQGLTYAQQLVKSIFDYVPCLVVELAKKGEDSKLPWDKSQPSDELAIFDLVKDDIIITKIGEFPNHLSKKLRPMYLVTKKKSVTVGANSYQYDHATSEAYEDSIVTQMKIVRKYYFGPQVIVKEYQFDHKSKHENEAQILSEISRLFNLAKKKIYHAPEMLAYEVLPQKRARLALKKVTGQLLRDVKTPLNLKTSEAILNDVAHSLADLERLGLYHNDIRSWNVIIDKNSAWLIDYGLVEATSRENNAIAFLWMAHTALSGQQETTTYDKSVLPDKKVFTSPKLKKVYQAVVKNSTSITFAEIYALLNSAQQTQTEE